MLQEPTVVHSEPANTSTTHFVHGLMQFLLALRYRKNIVLTALLVVGMFGGLYYTTATPFYRATASVMVMGSGVEGDSITMSPAGGLQHNLMPTFESLFSYAEVIKGALPYIPPEDRIDLAGAPEQAWTAILKANLTTQVQRGTNIIDVSYQSKSPKAAVAVLNAIIESYVGFLDQTHKGSAGELIDLLTRETAANEQKLAAKEQELRTEQLRMRDIGLRSDSKQQDPTVQRVNRYQEALDNARLERMTLQSWLHTLQVAVSRGDDLQQHAMKLADVVGRELLLNKLGINQQDARLQTEIEKRLWEAQAELETMRKDWGPNHAQIIKMEGRINKMYGYLAEYRNRLRNGLAEMEDTKLGPMLVQMVHQKLDEAWQQELALEAEFRKAEQEAVSLNSQRLRLETITRERDRYERQLDGLWQKLADTELVHNAQEVRPTVVQQPVEPSRPFSPNLKRVILMSLLAGLALGMALVYVSDILDDRFRSVEEMQSQLNIPVLAMIRQLPTTEATGPGALPMHTAPNSAESEAFRTLRTALALADNEARQIVISSSEPGDGKTTVLANLAAACAQSDKRTLLIDADLRRPGMTALMGMRGIDGLSSIIRGDTNVVKMATEHIRPSGIDRLDVLASGPRPANPAELLANPRFSELLAWAETVYDQVLIDSPPALATSDTAVIGRLVDGAVIVVQPDKNRRRAVMRATESLTKMKIPLLGLVVNRIGSDRDRGYYGYGSGYGYGYGYGYSDGYGSDGEADGATGERKQNMPDVNPADRTTYEQVVPGNTVVPRRIA